MKRTFSGARAMILALSALAFNGASAAPGDGLFWLPHPTDVVPAPDLYYGMGGNSGNWTSDLQYANGLWILGDGYGQIWYSSDASDWSKAVITDNGLPRSMQNSSLRSINYGANGTFIATFIGGGAPNAAAMALGMVRKQDAPVARSSDGIHWDVRTLPESCGPHFSATNGNGTWIIPGCGDHILVSTDDGKTWSVRSTGLPPAYGYALWAHAYLNGVWVVGAGDGAAGGIYYSTNLTSWTKALTYPDGLAGKRAIVLNGTLVFMGGRRFVATSTDGINWTQRHLDPPGSPFIQMQGGIWHPEYGYILGGESNSLLYSKDLITWSSATVGAIGATNEIVGMAISPAGDVYASGALGGYLFRLVPVDSLMTCSPI